MYENKPNILVTFLGETEHFSGKTGALRWSILVGKYKHNVQKPNYGLFLSVALRTKNYSLVLSKSVIHLG